jgi:outer membrane murein-binding lipoprotein Lpp
MNRTELFDKILNHLIDNPNNYWVLIPTCEKYFGVTDRRLIESIGDEIIERGWATPKKDDKYSVYIHYNGIEMMKKHKSYSSFEKSIKKANSRTKAEKNIKIILSIIGGIGIIYGCVFTYLNYQKDKKIDKQQTEIKKLNGKVDSLKTELKKRTTTPYIKNAVDSAKTKG